MTHSLTYKNTPTFQPMFLVKKLFTKIQFFLLVLVIACQSGASNESFDLVISNGRVIDPESGLDQVTDVGIRNESIVAIGNGLSANADKVIDATGLVVSPGFIDILSSDRPNKHAHTHKITDGVTTTMGMHGGPVDPQRYADRFKESGALINYGRAVGHGSLREAAGLVDGTIPANEEQIKAMVEIAEKAIQAGSAGIGFGINYTPGASYEEIFALFEVAAKNNVPCHLHARYKGNIFPGTMSLAVMEVVAMAAATGAQAQLAHLTSSTVGSAPLCLDLIEGGSKNGVDVGYDFHVWSRNMTYIQSALYDEGWEERFGGITYDSIFLASTQERLTEDRFFELRSVDGYTLVQTEFIPESEITMAIKNPMGIISSDGAGLYNKDGHEAETGHPRSTGTFARFLRKYIREQQVISLPDAIGRITHLPAKRLENSVPAMKEKGRIQIGSDADITIFDFETITENASYQKPYEYSSGIKYVLVNGTLVIDNEQIVMEVSPGKWMKHEVSSQ